MRFDSGDRRVRPSFRILIDTEVLAGQAPFRTALAHIMRGLHGFLALILSVITRFGMCMVRQLTRTFLLRQFEHAMGALRGGMWGSEKSEYLMMGCVREKFAMKLTAKIRMGSYTSSLTLGSEIWFITKYYESFVNLLSPQHSTYTDRTPSPFGEQSQVGCLSAGL